MESSRALGHARAPRGARFRWPAAKRRSRQLAVLLTAVLTGLSMLALVSASQAAAQTLGPAPGVTLGAAANGTQAPRLFYTDSGGQVWMDDLAQPDGSPVSLGGHLIGGPAAVWVPAGDLFPSGAFVVFGRGLDNGLWWTYQTATGWSGWASLGGGLTSKPAAHASSTSESPGSGVAVYVRGTDGTAWFRALSPAGGGGLAWQPWRSIGGQLLPGTGPAAAQASAGIFVAAVGTDRAVWVATFGTGSSGYVWRSVGGQSSSDPAVSVPDQSPMAGVVFVRGTDNATWYNEFSGQTPGVTAGWHSLGGGFTSGVTAIPAQVAAPQSPVYLFGLGTDNQAWMRTGTWPALGGWTRATGGSSALASCDAGTCWVAVNVATLWADPTYPRSIDRAALTNPADPRTWIASMSYAQKLWLASPVSRLETQALYGTKVTVIGHYGTAWTKVAIPSQPTNRDSRGYPGWVPTRQLTSTAPPAATTFAVIRTPTAWLWSSWTGAGVAGTGVMEVSYDTRLPVESATSAYVVVSLTGGRRLALRRSVVALYAAGTSWGATRANVVTEAKKFSGLQYLWAGTSGFGYDCSGFTYSVYHAYGVTLSRDADQQAVHGTAVARASLLPGDLVFFRSSSTGPIGHVGMYVGNGNMIDSPQTGAAVRTEPVSSYAYYAGARRYLSQ